MPRYFAFENAFWARSIASDGSGKEAKTSFVVTIGNNPFSLIVQAWVIGGYGLYCGGMFSWDNAFKAFGHNASILIPMKIIRSRDSGTP